jgi:hypothetical protein
VLSGLLADPPGRATLGARARRCAELHLDAADMVVRTYHLLWQAAQSTASR